MKRMFQAYIRCNAQNYHNANEAYDKIRPELEGLGVKTYGGLDARFILSIEAENEEALEANLEKAKGMLECYGHRVIIED